MKVLNAFSTLTLKAIFLMKLNETEYSDFETNFFFFKKLEYCFQLKALRWKTHHFHTKPPEINVKTNRMESTKSTYPKERSNYFIRFENFVSV